MRTGLGLLMIASSVIGCAHASDVEMGNPLVVGVVEKNQIVKPHIYTENQRGLPRGSMNDQATITAVDATQVCFDVTMHEVDPIDFHETVFRLRVKDGELETANIEAAPPTSATYQGLVAEQEIAGQETYCALRNSEGTCTSWRTRPVYVTKMVPGPVQVYEARGRLCFDNANQRIFTASTPQLTLEVKMRRRLNGAAAAAPMANIFSFGMAGAGANKSVVFRWGFTGKGGKV